MLTLCWIAFRGAAKSYPVFYGQQRPGASHRASNIVPAVGRDGLVH